MSGIDDWIERRIDAFVRLVPGWTVLIVTLVCYPGLGLLLPIALDVSRVWFITINILGVTLAALLSLGWLFVQLEMKDRRHLFEWTTELRHLDAREFEWLVGELFQREGWNVRQRGSQDGPDGMVDVELKRAAERRIVQCKRWTAAQVQVDDIRTFAGALLREGLRGSDGTFVTLSRFNRHAVKEAGELGMELIDGADLYSRVERVRREEPCPICERAMTLDRSQHGWWFRCTAAGCPGKRDLGTDPAVVVQLLTTNAAVAEGATR